MSMHNFYFYCFLRACLTSLQFIASYINIISYSVEDNTFYIIKSNAIIKICKTILILPPYILQNIYNYQARKIGQVAKIARYNKINNFIKIYNMRYNLLLIKNLTNNKML